MARADAEYCTPRNSSTKQRHLCKFNYEILNFLWGGSKDIVTIDFTSKKVIYIEHHLQKVLNIFGQSLEIQIEWYKATLLVIYLILWRYWFAIVYCTRTQPHNILNFLQFITFYCILCIQWCIVLKIYIFVIVWSALYNTAVKG